MTTAAGRRGWLRLRETLRRIYHSLPVPPHSNYTFRRVDPFAPLSDNAVVFNIGSEDTPLQPPRNIRIVTVDIDPAVAPDILADAHDLHMIPSDSADGVLVISVLPNALLFSFGSRTLYGINVDLFRWLLFWVKYPDVLLAKHPAAHVIHTGTYFLGRKGSRP